jgi:hypothetical protein
LDALIFFKKLYVKNNKIHGKNKKKNQKTTKSGASQTHAKV